MTIKRMLENKTSEDVCRNIRNVKLNDFVFQHAFYCHVCHRSLSAISYYNMAGRATQSNSVYVSVLQISIVHSRTDGASKSLSQKFFFARAAIVSVRQNIIFRDNKRYKQRLGPPVQNEDNFPTFSLGLEFLKERKTAEK